MKKTKGFRIQKTGKPVLEKVSVKLLMTARERVMLDLYAEKSGIDKTTIATKAVNLFVKGDGYFKELIKKDLTLQDKIKNAKTEVKKAKVEVKKPIPPTVVKPSFSTLKK